MEENELSILRPRTNLYGLIVAPPDEFHKSSQIDYEDELAEDILKLAIKKIETIYDDLPVKLPHNDPGENTASSSFDGSPEGMFDLLEDKTVNHFKAPEFGIKLKLQSPGRYDYGLISMLNNLYYGIAVDRILRNQRRHIPEGRYVTLFGDLHPDELTSETLKEGLLRRCILVKKTYRDIDLESVNNAYETQNNEWFSMTMEHYKRIISDVILGFYRKTYPTTYTISDSALEILKRIRLEGSKRIREEEVPRYPNENAELVLRIATNMMLFEFAIQQESMVRLDKLEVDERHIRWSLEYLHRIVGNYKEGIAKLEEPDISGKYERMQRKIVELTENDGKGVPEWKLKTSFNWSKKWSKERFTKFMDTVVANEMASYEVKNTNGKGTRIFHPPDA